MDAYSNVSNSFNNLTRTLLTLKGQEMQNALTATELQMRGNQFNRDMDFKEQDLAFRRQQAPIGQTDYSPVQHARTIANLERKTGLKRSIEGFSNNYLTPFSLDRNARVDTVYDNIAAMDKEQISEFLTNVANEHQEKLNKDPNYARTREAKNTERFMDILYNSDDGAELAAGLFPDVGRVRQEADANSKAALLQATSAERQALANPETQFIINKTKQYEASGMPRESATVKAYEDLSAIRARQAREGRVNVSLNAASGGQVDTLARGIVDGTINPDAISKRGGLQAAVWARVKDIDPTFDIVAAGAGAKFQQSTATMQTKALLNAIDPLLVKLEESGAILGNSSVPLYNKARNYLKEQTGSDDIVGFNNLRDDVIAEVERGLLGTGVLSDSKYMRALKNVNSAQSYPQLQAAVENMRIVIAARLEALYEGPNAPMAHTKAGGSPETPQRRATDTNRPPLSSFQK